MCDRVCVCVCVLAFAQERTTTKSRHLGRFSALKTGRDKALRWPGGNAIAAAGRSEPEDKPDTESTGRRVLVEAYFLAEHPEHVNGSIDHRCYDTARGLRDSFPGLRATCLPCLSLCVKHRRTPLQCGAARHCVLVHVKSPCTCATSRRFLTFNATSPKPIYHVHDVVDNFEALNWGSGTLFDAKFVNTAAMLKDGKDAVAVRLPNGTILPASPSSPPSSSTSPLRPATSPLQALSPLLNPSATHATAAHQPPQRSSAFHVVPHYHINDEGIVATPKPKPTLVTWVGHAPLEPSTKALIKAMLRDKHAGVELRRHKFNSRDKAASMRALAASDAVLVWDQCYRTPRGAPSNPTWHYQCSSWKPGGRLTYAMSLGLPVLAHSMYAANREIVKRSVSSSDASFNASAVGFSLADESNVVQKLDDLLGNFTLRKELSSANLEASRAYSRAQILRRYRRMLIDTLPRAVGGGAKTSGTTGTTGAYPLPLPNGFVDKQL